MRAPPPLGVVALMLTASVLTGCLALEPTCPADGPDCPGPAPGVTFAAGCTDPPPYCVRIPDRTDLAVEVGDDFFEPGSAEVRNGSVIRWRNFGGSPHSVEFLGDVEGPRGPVVPDGRNDRILWNATHSAAFLFITPGTYEYRCGPHEYMRGTIVVREAEPGGAHARDPAGAAADPRA